MESEWSEWGRYLRIGLAGVIFVLLLVGGGAAALTALAAGLNALSGGSVTVARQVEPTLDKQPAEQVQQSGQAPPASVEPVQHAATTASSSSTTTVSSPIGEAIDSGGVVIGNHVQATFGRVLSHVLQTLFMEQAGASKQGSGS